MEATTSHLCYCISFLTGPHETWLPTPSSACSQQSFLAQVCLPPSKSQSCPCGQPVSSTLLSSLHYLSDGSPPHPFSYTGLLAVPLKGWEHWLISLQGRGTGCCLPGWLPVVTFAGRPCSDQVFKTALPPRRIPPSCLILIHRFYLHLTHSVAYLFVLLIFSPCPHQNGSSSEAGTLIGFGH